MVGLAIFSLHVKFGKCIFHEVTHILNVTSLVSKHYKYGHAATFRGYTPQVQSSSNLDFSTSSSQKGTKVTAQTIQFN